MPVGNLEQGASSSAAMAKIIKLRSSDDRIFEVEDSVAKMSVTIRNMLEGNKNEKVEKRGGGRKTENASLSCAVAATPER